MQKNKAAASMARLRWEKLTPEERKAHAQHAARARWAVPGAKAAWAEKMRVSREKRKKKVSY